MTTSLARLKDGYTNGGRSVALRFMQSFRSIPLTPNQLTTGGFLLNVVAGVLIYEQHWVWATVVFVAGSVIDALDGALARAHDKMTPFGGFLDSTLDRMSEGVILGAIALVLADRGDTLALACVFVALVGSFLVSYTRAKAEALGLKGDVGLMARAERIVLLAVVLPFAGRGQRAALCDLHPGRPDDDHRRPAHRLRTHTTEREIGGIGMAETASQNGHRASNGKVRVAIIGVGNCASSFVQGVQYYQNAKAGESVPGLMHVNLGGYHISDIEFSAAFDIDDNKVGKDLSEAIFSGRTTPSSSPTCPSWT